MPRARHYLAWALISSLLTASYLTGCDDKSNDNTIRLRSIDCAGVLPVFGFTYHLDASLIPVEPGLLPDGIFDDFYHTYLEPCHIKVFRFDVNVTQKPQDTWINRLYNLCLWCEEKDVYLLPILGGVGDYQQGEEESFPADVHDFALGLAEMVMQNKPELLTRIIMYQLENEMTNLYYHSGWSYEDQYAMLAATSKAVRDAEKMAFDGYSKAPGFTPLMINFAMAWMYLGVGEYTDNILAKGGIIDVLGIDDYPGSWDFGQGSYRDLVDQTITLALERDELVMVAESGFSACNHHAWQSTHLEQRNYYAGMMRALIDYYDNGGKDDGFIGISWYQTDSRFLPTCDVDPIMCIEFAFGIIKDNGDGSYEILGNDSSDSAWHWLAENMDANHDKMRKSQ